jgi:8-oxo-dGTP pyrophosphatase MutT (NUDIX family)
MSLLFLKNPAFPPPNFPFLRSGIARKNFGNPKVHLAYAAKRAAARELFEETGLDFRDQLDRIEPAHLKEYPSKPNLLTFEHKHRIFFQLFVTDNDFFQNKVCG